MAVTALNHPGQDNAAGDVLANLKIQYSGLIATQYQAGLKLAPTIMNRSFPRGAKQVEVKFHDEETAIAHVPGEDLFIDGTYSGNPQKGSKVINLNSKLIKAGMLDEWEGYQEDFPSIMVHTDAIRKALQKADEVNCFRAIVAAAVRNGGADEYTNEPDLGATGTTTLAINGAFTAAKADILRDGLYQLWSALDQQDVPEEGRTFAIHPLFYPLLFMSTDKAFINRDYGNNNGSNSSMETFLAAGFRVVKTSNIPRTDLTTPASKQAELDRDFTNTVGAVYNKEAAIRFAAQDVRVQMVYDMRLQANTYAASLMAAYGSWRRECAIWIKGS